MKIPLTVTMQSLLPSGPQEARIFSKGYMNFQNQPPPSRPRTLAGGLRQNRACSLNFVHPNHLRGFLGPSVPRHPCANAATQSFLRLLSTPVYLGVIMQHPMGVKAYLYLD